MKKVISLFIVALLLSSLMIPGVFAMGTDLSEHDVYVSDTMLSYGYTENGRTMVIMVYPQESRAELAYGYADETVMYSAEIALPDSVALPYSSKYWKAVEMLALSTTDAWCTVDKPTPELPPDGPQAVTDIYDVFDSFIADTFGDDYFGYHLSNQVINGIPFTLMQGQQSTVIEQMQFGTNNFQTFVELAYTAIDFMLNFIPLPPTHNAVATALMELTGGVLDSLDHIMMYEINCDIFRYVSHVSNEDFPYSVADHMIYYVAFGDPADADKDPAIIEQAIHEYIPSQAFFNSYSDQFSAAYADYLTLHP